MTEIRMQGFISIVKGIACVIFVYESRVPTKLTLYEPISLVFDVKTSIVKVDKLIVAKES